MKNFKKIGALVLALIMVLALSSTAFATDGDSLYHDGLNSDSKTVTIKKEITAYNPDATTVNEPTATYTYTIAEGTANVSITDKDGYQAVTYAGVTTGVTMTSTTDNTAGPNTTLTYGPTAGTLTTAAAGATNLKDVVIDFSAVAFQQPGVYRYTITETAAIYDSSNGIVSAGTNGVNTRYLDVYVKASSNFAPLNTTVASTEPEYKAAYVAGDWDIYGYALFTTDNTAIIEKNRTGGNEDTLYKTTGFVADSSQSSAVPADSYYTFNLTLTKTVANDAFVQNLHTEFPFHVTFSNATVTQNVLPTETLGSYATTTSTALAADAISNIVVTPTIGHGGSVTYSGIPSGTQITVYETNSVSNVIYAVTEAGSTGVTFTGSNIATNQNSGNAVVAAQNVSETNADRTVAFTNTLLNISPTGVVLRVAPFVMILAAGIILFLITRRRRADAEA